MCCRETDTRRRNQGESHISAPRTEHYLVRGQLEMQCVMLRNDRRKDHHQSALGECHVVASLSMSRVEPKRTAIERSAGPVTVSSSLSVDPSATET